MDAEAARLAEQRRELERRQQEILNQQQELAELLELQMQLEQAQAERQSDPGKKKEPAPEPVPELEPELEPEPEPEPAPSPEEEQRRLLAQKQDELRRRKQQEREKQLREQHSKRQQEEQRRQLQKRHKELQQQKQIEQERQQAEQERREREERQKAEILQMEEEQERQRQLMEQRRKALKTRSSRIQQSQQSQSAKPQPEPADSPEPEVDDHKRRLNEQKRLILQRQKAMNKEEAEQAILPKPRVTVTVSGNGLDAVIEITRVAQKTAAPMLEDILEALNARGVIFGINHAIITQIIRQPVYGRRLLVARGKAPLTGKDGYVKYLVRTERVLRPREREDGTVDYRDIGFIETVSKNQPLAEIFPAEKGIDGRDVFGKPIEGAYGKPPKIPAGRNTVHDEERNAVFSAVDGSVEVVRGIINVQDVLRIHGSVDTSTGNINFPGDIYIAGDVLSGFSVISQGCVIISGSVEDAKIEAAADVSVGEGINGLEHGVLVVGGNLRCKYIQNCMLQVGKNLYADSVMHCNILCGGSVELAGKRGTLIGGTAAIAGKLTAKTIGWGSHTPTYIEMAADIEQRDYDIEEMEEVLAALQNEQLTLQRVVERVAEISMKTGSISKEHADSLRKIQARLEIIAEERREVEAAIANTQKTKAESIDERSFIECSDRLHTGVKIAYGNAILVVQQGVPSCLVTLIDGEVKTTPMLLY